MIQVNKDKPQGRVPRGQKERARAAILKSSSQRILVCDPANTFVLLLNSEKITSMDTLFSWFYILVP